MQGKHIELIAGAPHILPIAYAYPLELFTNIARDCFWPSDSKPPPVHGYQMHLWHEVALSYS